MHGASSGVGGESDGAVLRRYYGERDYMTSPEGIMKLLSVVLCIALSVLLLRGSCAGPGAGAPLSTVGAAVELTSAAALAGLSAARLLQLVVYAPMGCLFADLIVSTVIGISLLVTAALGLTVCAELRVVDYVHGVLGVATAAVVTASAVITYVTVTRRWDAARGPGASPRRPASTELEV